jgi:N-hydroxyarylamine O-acetyltransferase
MMDDSTLAAYFRRLAVPRPYTADAVSLHVLHRAHQMTVPFENLSIHLSEPISLAEDDLIDKIVTRRRGGFCYELNGAFAVLLQAMGAEVRRVAARVFGDGRTGPPFGHMALVVHASDASGPWLIDVGFGSHSVYPLLFDSRHGQDDPAGSFLLVDTEDGDVDVLKDGKPQYRIEPRERSLADFIPACWWQQTSPESHFTRSTICSRLTNGGRVSISGRTLITTEGGSRSEQHLPDDAAVLTAYRDHFGIVLDQVPPDPAAPSADAASPPAVRSADAVPSPAPAASTGPAAAVPSPAPAASTGPAAIPPDGPSTPAASGSQTHPSAPPVGRSSPAYRTSPASSAQESPPALL